MAPRICRFLKNIRLGFCLWAMAAISLSLYAMEPSSEDRKEETPAEPPKKNSAHAGKSVSGAKMGQDLIMARFGNAPKVGDVAPDFKLERADGKGPVRLYDFRGKRPVALVFGSYT